LRQLIDELPDEVDVDALMERLYVLRKLELSEQAIARGEVLEDEEVREQFKQWLE
jgi:hypothetical protein